LSLDHVLDALKDAGFEDMVSAVALQVNGRNSAVTASLFIAEIRVCAHFVTLNFLPFFSLQGPPIRKETGGG
jgi:hypothetical protein